jgi:outer membrane protein insertion porin family
MHILKLSAPNMSFGGRYFLLLVAMTLSLFLSCNSAATAESSILIKMIEIRGNKKISTSTISSKMRSREGAPFSKNAVQEDIKKLYSIGYFDDIRVEIDSFEGGVKLIYTFIEKPMITSLDFQGNEEFKSKDLKEKITLTTGAIANRVLITDNARRLVAYYQSEGYWLAKAVPIISEVSEGAVAVTYQIEEGPKVKIKKVTIEGNKALSEGDIKKVMQTKKWWILSFLMQTGYYKLDQISNDIMRIKELYQRKGYLYIAVSEPEVTLSPDNKKLFVTLTVSEGDQFSIGDFSIKGNTVFSDEEIYEPIETDAGQIFNRTALRNDIDKIIDMYMNRGYARADVNPQIDVNDKDKIVRITLSISEGGIYRIGRIDVTGNTKTRDKVIRREMRLDEGDIYNSKRLSRSQQRINNLQYFESVDFKSTPDMEERLMDIDVNVKEKMTGMLSLGGGYSSLDNLMLMGEINQTNLFGRGLDLKLKLDFSSRRTNFNIALRDPWFMDKPLSASFAIYVEEVDYDDYDKEAVGGSIAFGKSLSEYVAGNIRYKLEDATISNVSETASSIIKDQEGDRITSAIMPTITRDTRDNYLTPSRGSKNAFYATVAGLGGDNFYYKGSVDSMWFFPVIWDTRFMFRGRYGYASGYNGEELPLYERFYVGGINTVRGLAFKEAGPRAEDGEKIGGVEQLIFNFEYIFPILKDLKIDGVVFFDFGSAFDKDENYPLNLENMRESVGAGLRWVSPFGPIRIEWGYSLDPIEGEKGDRIEFSMGGFF